MLKFINRSIVIPCCVAIILLSVSLPSFAQTETDSVSRGPVFQVPVSNDKPKTFRVAVGGGYAYRLGSVAKTGNSDIDRLSKKIKSGYQLDADIAYYFHKDFGIGLNLNYVGASASTYGSDLTTSMTYVGPTFSVRFGADQFMFYCNLGMGPLFYKEELKGYGTYDKVAFGFQANISGEYLLTNNIGLGLKLGYILASVEEPNMPDDYDRLNLSNLGIGAYISFKTGK